MKTWPAGEEAAMRRLAGQTEAGLGILLPGPASPTCTALRNAILSRADPYPRRYPDPRAIAPLRRPGSLAKTIAPVPSP